MTTAAASPLGDFPDEEFQQRTTTAGRFLATRPTPAEVCRFLVLHTPWQEGARGALLAVCQDDGHLEIAGAFGYPRPLVEAYRRLALFDRTPLTDAITSEQPLRFGAGARMADHYPVLCQELGGYADSADMGSLIAVPLISDSGPVGALGMTFADPIEDNTTTCGQLTALVPLLTVHLSLCCGADAAAVTPLAPVAPIEIPETPAAGLTKRQMRVLHMLAKKMTNQQIAAALDYSLSTVRLDTMAIYRALDVAGRREAVEKARSLGIITAQAPMGQR